VIHEVLTTEKVPFTYRVAGLGSRFLAWLIDLVFWLLLVVGGMMLRVPLEIARPGVGDAAMLLWIFLVSFLFSPLFEWLWQGQTPGKRALGIRVIELRGTSVSFLSTVIRNLVRFADFLPICYATGAVAAMCDPKQRRLGDWAAGTLVVHDQRQARPIRVVDAGQTAEGRAEDLAARQRLVNLTREHKQTLLDLCLRRNQLRVAERAKLFRALAEYLDAELGLAAHANESDERFVLRMAALLSERGPIEADLAPTRGRSVGPRRVAARESAS
jgi:uncharacterized RDD family membrane protein YckC